MERESSPEASELKIGEKKIAYWKNGEVERFGFKNPHNWRRLATIHTHPVGRKFSANDANWALNAEKHIYMISLKSTSLYYFNAYKFEKNSFYYIPSHVVDDATFDMETLKDATEETKDFLDKYEGPK